MSSVYEMKPEVRTRNPAAQSIALGIAHSLFVGVDEHLSTTGHFSDDNNERKCTHKCVGEVSCPNKTSRKIR